MRFRCSSQCLMVKESGEVCNPKLRGAAQAFVPSPGLWAQGLHHSQLISPCTGLCTCTQQLSSTTYSCDRSSQGYTCEDPQSSLCKDKRGKHGFLPCCKKAECLIFPVVVLSQCLVLLFPKSGLNLVGFPGFLWISPKFHWTPVTTESQEHNDFLMNQNFYTLRGWCSSVTGWITAWQAIIPTWSASGDIQPTSPGSLLSLNCYLGHNAFHTLMISNKMHDREGEEEREIQSAGLFSTNTSSLLRCPPTVYVFINRGLLIAKNPLLFFWQQNCQLNCSLSGCGWLTLRFSATNQHC